jgi:cyclin-dependent kinase 8/11
MFRRYKDRLEEWCKNRIRSKEGYELMRILFAYDPEQRLTAREALDHKWFQEEPIPTQK